MLRHELFLAIAVLLRTCCRARAAACHAAITRIWVFFLKSLLVWLGPKGELLTLFSAYFTGWMPFLSPQQH